jgi:hypothetical protein
MRPWGFTFYQASTKRKAACSTKHTRSRSRREKRCKENGGEDEGGGVQR